MSRVDYDLIVAGAGPAGSMAALTAAQAGLRVALVEEHPEVGSPVHCSGKIQLHAFREFDLPRHLVMNTLQAGVFYAPDGSVVRVRRAQPDSHVVDRAVFDRWLADEAQRHGAELILRTRLIAAERRDGVMQVRGRRNGRSLTLAAPLVIDAEGARPVLPASLGLRFPRLHVLGVQYQMDHVELEEEDCPEIYLGRSYAPGFFAWIMPIGGRRARAGLCVDPRQASRGPGYYLERLIREHPVASRRLRGAVVERKLAGPIPVLGARRPSVIGGMLIAGDAAGQVKATSGGGIYFALIAGRLAARAARRFLGGDAGALRWYERQWRRRFGRELQVTAFARATLNHLTDGELNALIASLGDDEHFRRIVEQRGDTAYQSRLMIPVLAATLRWSRARPVRAVLVKTVRYGLEALWDGGARLSARMNGNVG